MATKRDKTVEIVTKLRQVDVPVGQGQPRIDAIRQVQITEQTIIVGASSTVAWGCINSES